MAKKLTVSIKEKSFPEISGIQVLGELNFEVQPEEFVCIVGPSGCGKSTLLRLIVGLDTDYQGTILLGERKISGPEKECGMVFQEPRLLPWLTVEENIHFGLYESVRDQQSREQIAEFLRLFHITDFAHFYPNQLTSGGMAKKVALARALINVPDLLLLDEPFSSLDQITKMKLQDELARVLSNKRTTVLMVTHDLEEAVYLGDRIIVMSPRPGKITKSFSIPLPKPRVRTSQELEEIRLAVLRYMSEELKLF